MSLPLLPGRTPKDLSKTTYGRSHQFDFVAGIPVAKKNSSTLELSQDDIEALTLSPSRSQGPARVVLPPVVPAFVALDKKVLLFNGYFKQTVHESAEEFFRVRYAKIFYYLEDDTISIVEPVVENSGLPQGKLVNRQKLPKNNAGATWHWKDLNIGADVTIYGRTFHLYDMNEWTRGYLTSQGIVVGAPEEAPADQYTTKRVIIDKPISSSKTPSDFDKLKQFIALDRRVLRFFAVWDDRAELYGEKRKYLIHYYLVDDTVEVREVHESNDGRDPFPVLIRRQKIPRNLRDLPGE